MKKVTILIREAFDVTDENLHKQLKRLGFQQKNVFETIGSIEGELPDTSIDSVKDLDAVAWIEIHS